MTRTGRPPLLPKKREDAIAAYVAGATYQAIADELGVSDTAIRNWVKRAGVQRRARAPKELIQQAVADYVAGMSAVKVAEKYGFSHTFVFRWLKRAGVPARPAHQGSTQDSPVRQEAVAAYLAGEPAQVVAERYGVSRAAIWKWVRQTRGSDGFRMRGGGCLTPFGEEVHRAGGRSIQDVANRAGLSTAAVRRALATSPAKELADPRTVRAILDAFPAIDRGLGYRLAFDPA